MDKRQVILLGLGLLLGLTAISLRAVQKAEVARQEEEAQRQAEEEALAAAERMEPLPGPARGAPPPGQAPAPLQRNERMGAFWLRVSAGGDRGGLFSSSGDLIAEVQGFQGARVVEGVALFDGPVVELTGQPCEDPCNPTVVLVTQRQGRPHVALRTRGVVRLDDLDGDRVPEALVDHLVDDSPEVVTLPYRLNGLRFENAYARFPDGVDRQVAAMSREAESSCSGGELTDECRAPLKALLGLAAFATPEDPLQKIRQLELSEAARDFAKNQDRVEQIRQEIAALIEEGS